MIDKKEERIGYPLVEIDWMDAQSSLERFHIDEVKELLKPLHTKSAGYLIHETPNYIILGFMILGNELIKHHQLIPRAMIQKISYLKVKNK